MKHMINKKNGFAVALLFLLLFPALSYSALTSVTVTPGSATAGQPSIHTVSFVHADTIPADGVIVIRYPSGFDLSNMNIVYSPSMDETIIPTVSGQTVTIRRDGTGDPEYPGHTETIQLANVTNATLVGSYQVSVETQNADNSTRETGTSASFTLTAGSVNTFNISLPTSVTSTGAVAGTAFQATIEAQDAYGNRATSFASTATLSDPTGSLVISSNGANQTTNTFSSGLWSGNVRILKTVSTSSNYIQATSGTHSGTSSTFTVLPGALDEFMFGSISSPQTAGVSFVVTITAYDAYDNIKTDYTSTATLSEKTGTITVPATASSTTGIFTAGIWSGNVQITEATTDIYIQATGGGRTGTSGPFNVNGASVAGFSISNISTQSAGEYFLVTVTAVDGYGNTATSFGGSVTISHSGAGTISPTTSGTFSNGEWTGNLRISQTQSNDQISVNDGSGHTGASNYFDIISSSVQSFDISYVATTQTAGTGFSVTIQALDNNGNVADFDGQVNVIDETRTNTPQQVTMTDGTWTGTITITEAQEDNFLTATALSKTGTSNDFDVVGASVSRFELSEITSPKTAGTAFSVTITAYDTYGNIAQSFSGSVTLSTGSVAVSPTSVSAFSNGSRTVNLTITEAANDIRITATDGSHSGSSNYFNITHNTLNHFAIADIATQTPGVPFSITVTAQDAYDNTVTSFSGSGNRVTITHTGSGSLSLSQSDDFENGVWSGALSVLQTQTTDRIVATRVSGGSQTGTSNYFAVTPTTVDHFTFSSISSSQTAGTSFSVTVRAYDVNDNLVTAFSGTANLADETGTNSPKQITFTSGVGTATVTITKTQSGNTLTVTALGSKSGVSSEFEVAPGALQSISVATVASPQIAGEDFAVNMTALDAYGNTATQFTGTVVLSDLTGTLTRVAGGTTSGSFIAGLRTEAVLITEASNDVVINVTQSGIQRGQSNLFNVLPAVLDGFTIESISDQIIGVPFSITITAEDEFGNVKTDFTQTVEITDETGTISPDVSLNFSNGEVTTPVTVHQATSNDVIRVTRGTVSSTSNAFDVVVNPGIQISDFNVVGKDSSSTIQAVTTNQDSVWFLRCTVENLSGAQAHLDSVRLEFKVAGVERDDYNFQLPTTFWGNGSETLPGNGTDSLLIPVIHTGENAGAATIRLFVYLKNMDAGSILSDDAFTSLQVQTPANLVILKVQPSQNEVSRSQTQPWRVSVIVSNTGGSAVQMDSTATETYLTFSLGASSTWEVLDPPSWSGGDWVLEGSEIDSLIYVVRRTTSQAIGECRIDGAISGVETNTGRRIEQDTQTGGNGQVLIEIPAVLSITQTTNSAPNAPYVNRTQAFNLDIQIANTGGDDIEDVGVQIETTGSSTFIHTYDIGTLSGGDSYLLTVPVTAANQNTLSEIFTASAGGTAENTDLYIENSVSSDDTAKATIQNPAAIQVLSVIPTETQLLGGQSDSWQIKVAVRNTGGAALTLSKPASDSVSFSVGDIYQEDYKVTPPTALKGGGLVLRSGITDTLIYTVNTTGTYGGSVSIQVSVGGKDKNSLATRKTTGTTQVTVEAEEKFRIISTQIHAVNITEAMNGYVNTGQAFQVLAILENGLGYTIRNINVQLKSDGQSTIPTPQIQITTLGPSKRDSVWFDVTAASGEDSGEIFTAEIIAAKRENGTDDAAIGKAIDSTAQVVVQTPATVSLTVASDPESGVVSVNQEFTVTASLVKAGSSSLKGDGRVRIYRSLSSYSLVTGTDTASISLSQPATWTLQAPSAASSDDEIRAVLERYPYDKNTNAQVKITDNASYWDRVYVTTIASRLNAVTTISTPTGASDGILSSGQAFVVKTEVAADNVKDITVKIQLPDGYKTNNSLLQGVIGDTATWQVTAPDNAVSEQTIFVTAEGFDALQPSVSISAPTDQITVTTVSRAALALSLSVISPAEAVLNRTVSPGQEFVIQAEVTNEGEAQTEGNVEVTLQTLPSGYTTQDLAKKILTNGKATWTIKAPTTPSSTAAQIEVRITETPTDENTNQSAYVRTGNQVIAISLQSSWLAVSRFTLSSMNQSVSPGQEDVPLMGLALDNRGESGSYPIDIQEITLVITGKDGEEIAPNSALSRIEIVSVGGDTVYGFRSQISATNPITISLDGLEITYDLIRKIVICGDIAETEIVPYFLVNLSGGESIIAKETSSDLEVPVKNPTKDDLENIQSEVLRIFDPAQDSQLWSSPNPFGEPGKETTYIYYYVPDATRLTFKIFTIVGKLVKTYEIPETEVIAGQVSRWTWDGTNDKGAQVLNGIYHLIMQTGDGETIKFKMAYVK